MIKTNQIYLLIFFLLLTTWKWQPDTDKSSWEAVTAILERINPPEFSSREFSVLKFGAIADGVSNSKPAIDKAIEACALAGGGSVVLPPGRYLCKGPIHLQSNINLHLSSGAYLSFSHDPDDYLPVVTSSWEGTRLYNYSPFIYAYQKTNVAITGKGIIDGSSGGVFNQWQKLQRSDQKRLRKMNNDGVPLEERIFGKGHFLRPHLIQFYKCENVLMEDVTILDSPFWCIHLIYSKNITVRGLVFNAQQLNNDGIDPESCEDVLIENVLFNNNDDNIAIKAGRDREGRLLQQPSQNIVVRNCQFKGHNALAIGSEMSGGVNNIFVEDCSFNGNVRNGIYLKSNKDRGGKISNIFIRNVTFGKTSTVIRIDSDYKNEGIGFPPSFENIHIENIEAREAGTGIYIKGTAEKPVNRVVLKDIIIHKVGTGFSSENIKNVTFDNVKINGRIFSVDD